MTKFVPKTKLSRTEGIQSIIDIISNPDNLCKKGFAENQWKDQCYGWDVMACKWTILGAIQKVESEYYGEYIYNPTMSNLYSVIECATFMLYQTGVIEANAWFSHESVMEILKEALDLANKLEKEYE